jgi:hypothetical protein
VPSDDLGAPQMLWSEILAWSELTRIDLEPWEINALTLLGRAGQSAAADAFGAQMKQTKQKHGEHG